MRSASACSRLAALAIREAADRFRLADPAHVEETCCLHSPELRHGHEHVEDLCGRDILGRVTEDLFDLDVAVFEILLQACAPDADVVRSLQRLHALIE